MPSWSYCSRLSKQMSLNHDEILNFIYNKYYIQNFDKNSSVSESLRSTLTNDFSSIRIRSYYVRSTEYHMYSLRNTDTSNQTSGIYACAERGKTSGPRVLRGGFTFIPLLSLRTLCTYYYFLFIPTQNAAPAQSSLFAQVGMLVFQG